MKKINRIQLCLNYRLRSLIRASRIFMLVFVLVDLVLPLVLFALLGQRTSSFEWNFVMNNGVISLSYSFLVSAMIFLFVGFIASFREDFDFMLALNSTRKNQYLSILALIPMACGAYLIGALVIRFLEVLVESVISRADAAVLLADWARGFYGNLLADTIDTLVLSLAALTSACFFGLAVGIFAYRFGRYFVIPFWICFGASFIFLPIFITSNGAFRHIVFDWFMGANTARPPLTLALHLFGIDAGLLLLGYLGIRKLPQSK